MLGVGTKGVERRRKEEVCLCSVVNHNLSRQGRWSPLAVQTDIPASKKKKKRKMDMIMDSAVRTVDQ